MERTPLSNLPQLSYGFLQNALYRASFIIQTLHFIFNQTASFSNHNFSPSTTRNLVPQIKKGFSIQQSTHRLIYICFSDSKSRIAMTQIGRARALHGGENTSSSNNGDVDKGTSSFEVPKSLMVCYSRAPSKAKIAKSRTQILTKLEFKIQNQICFIFYFSFDSNFSYISFSDSNSEIPKFQF